MSVCAHIYGRECVLGESGDKIQRNSKWKHQNTYSYGFALQTQKPVNTVSLGQEGTQQNLF